VDDNVIVELLGVIVFLAQQKESVTAVERGAEFTGGDVFIERARALHRAVVDAPEHVQRREISYRIRGQND
jgi:hypothetical protein